MKKICLPLTLALTVGLSSVAFGATNVVTSGGQTEASVPTTSVVAAVRMSTNVTLLCSSGTSAYAAEAAHLQGTRTFGTTSGQTLIFWQPKTAGEAIVQGDLTSSDTAQFNSWTSL